MGYMRHHAIIVTGNSDDEELQKVRNRCDDINQASGNPCQVSLIYPSKRNHYGTFFIAPDGSKEGWDVSDDGDLCRTQIIEYLDTLRFGDNSTSFKYVEVQYGDDDHESKVLRHSEDERLPIG